MIKSIHILALCLLGIFLFSSTAGQTGLMTLFGPEIFIRGTGAPVVETREISIKGFHGPFIFHLRNGDEDGKNRVSSAKVWLNGNLLFGPKDFNQNQWGYDINVSLTQPSKLEVQLASSPGSKLKIWIEGNPNLIELVIIPDEMNKSTLLIKPEIGGTIEACGANGYRYILDIPPNALSVEKEISIAPIVIISGLPFAAGMTASVQMEPDGLRLLKPATLTIELPFPIPNNLIGFFSQNNGKGFHFYPAKIDGNKFIFKITAVRL